MNTAVAPHVVADPSADAELLRSLSTRFAATAAEYDRSGGFPHANFATLQQHGLVALVAPRAYGGGGATLAAARRVVAAVAYGEPATALVLTMTYLQHLAIARPDSRWPAHLRETISRGAVEQGALVNALRVEPALGSPARGGLPATVARSDGTRWTINGHKLYTTGIDGLHWLAVWARTDEDTPRTGTFLVQRNAPGVEIIRSWDHLGMRASGSHEVVFHQVQIPLNHAVDLRLPTDWLPHPHNSAETLAHANQQAWMVVLLGSLYDAVARAARDWLLGFLQTRAPGSLGAPLASLPRVEEVVGEIEALLRNNRLLLDSTTTTVDAGQSPSASDSGLLKFTLTSNAVRAVELALQLSGNHGLNRRNPLERHYRDVLCSRIHTPQNDASLVAAGKAALAAFQPVANDEADAPNQAAAA